MTSREIRKGIILVSGSGIGAGKSTLARKLVGAGAGLVVSLGDGIREELSIDYPEIDWYNKSQSHKDTPVQGTDMTVRDHLIQRGQERCVTSPTHWVDHLFWRLTTSPIFTNTSTIVVDDLRKVVELKEFRRRTSTWNNCLHFHIEYPSAIYEPQYDGEQLRELADYVVTRGQK